KLCDDYWSNKANMHKVQPGMVYLSNPTETGTLYSKAELIDFHKVCKDYDMKLFIDGARLGYGLVAETNDLSLEDLDNLTDVFYFGRPKLGESCIEVYIYSTPDLIY